MLTRLMGLAALLLIAASSAYAWDWKLPNDRFQELDVFARDQYQKAEKAYNEKNYKLAGSEFERYTLEFGNTAAVSAAAFMHAMSVLQDTKRNEARKLFEQVIDFFPDDRYYAGAAAFYIGYSYVEDGDIRKGLQAYETMVGEGGYPEHPLAANALKALADNAYKSNEMAKYVRYLTQCYIDFWDVNRGEADLARQALFRWHLRQQAYGKIEEVAAMKAYGQAPRENEGYWWDLWHRAHHETFANGEWYPPKDQEKRKADIEAFWTYWSGGATFLRERNLWAYQHRSVEYLLRYKKADRAAWEPVVKELAKPATPDDQLRHVIYQLFAYELYDDARELSAYIKDINSFADWYSQQLISRRLFDEAANTIAKITDEGARQWRLYELNWHKGDVKTCIEILQGIAANDPNRAVQAQYTLAYIYRDHTKQYDEAIKIYTTIAEQPRCDFEMAPCYERKGQVQKAADIYRGIENFFPEHAARAALEAARMWDRHGDMEKAIRDYRRILKIYPGTAQASEAHVRLEQLGVPTGGGEGEQG